MITVGSVVAGYRIERVLGAGGMGTVYLAQNPELPRRDALKVLSAELSGNPEFRARFVREADVAARLQHPNIVPIYSRGETEDGQLWIAMRFVDGTDADDALSAGTMTAARAMHIIGGVAQALDYAHSHKVVHRDIKPANFLLSSESSGPEQVFLGDFGIARGLDDAGLTATGSIVTTMAYAAPEVLAGLPFDGRADLYSLGCSLFRLLTGKTPFANASANGPAAVLMAHLHHPPPRVTDRVPGLPVALDWVFATALAKDPARRFQSAGEFASAASAAMHNRPAPGAVLRAVPSGEVAAYPSLADSGWWRPPADTRTTPAPPGLPTQMRPNTALRPYRPPTLPYRRRRRRWMVGALAAAVLLVAGTVTALMLTGDTGQHAASPPTTTTAPATPAPPTAPTVPVSALRGLLLPVDQVEQIMGGMNPQVFDVPATIDTSAPLAEKECAGAYEAAQTAAYATSGYTGVALQESIDQDDPLKLNRVIQADVGFFTAEQAQDAMTDQLRQWDQCANRTVTLNYPGKVPAHVTFGAPVIASNGVHVITSQIEFAPQQHCEHALGLRNNVVIDVNACSTKRRDQGAEIAGLIAERVAHA